MGLDSADFNQDGWMDLFVANIDHEMYSLYHNNHDETFDDQALTTGIGTATRLMSGWGLKFFDYDNDGNLDLMLANGNPDDLIEELSHHQVGYREPLLLFHNSGNKWTNVSAQSGPVFQKPLSARGLAIGDFDNNGSVDLVIAVNDDAPLLIRNKAGSENQWLGLKLIGKKIEHRRDWGPRHLSSRRPEAQPHESRRWQLSFLSRSSHGARHRQTTKNRLAGNQMAATQRPR